MDLYYPRANKTDLVVTLKASVLSPLPSQIRFLIKGSKGSFVKYGSSAKAQGRRPGAADYDEGEDEEGYGREPEAIWGTVVEAKEDGEVTGQEGVRYHVAK